MRRPVAINLMKRYEKNEEIDEVVRTFEDATIGREKWKHAEHLTVALHYLCIYDIETATEKMRSGIFKLLTKRFRARPVKGNAVSRDADNILDADRGGF